MNLGCVISHFQLKYSVNCRNECSSFRIYVEGPCSVSKICIVVVVVVISSEITHETMPLGGGKLSLLEQWV